jgi:Zn-dependent protease
LVRSKSKLPYSHKPKASVFNLSPPSVDLIRKCKRCSSPIPPEALVCVQCHALVHAEELERLAALANECEEQNDFKRAEENWLKALERLPLDSTQAAWIRSKVKTLTLDLPHPESKHEWAKKLGPLAPLAVALSKAKVLLSVFKLKFLLSLFAFMWVYWTLFGAKFGIGFAILILIHEMGHFIDIKRRGLPAEMPVFLPGLGAYVRWHALGVSNETRAAVSLAGPLAGWLSAAVCALLFWKTGNTLWAALARAGAWLNVLNLIPVWLLDGGQAMLVLNKAERLVLLTACLVLWLLVGESVFFLVALGVVWSLFAKDMPSQPNRAITAYFVIVLSALGFVLWIMPGQGFGSFQK